VCCRRNNTDNSNNNINNNTIDNVYGAVIMASPLRKFIWFTWWKQTERRVAASNTHTKRTDLVYSESAGRLLPSTSIIAVYYYYSVRKLIPIYCPTRVEGGVDLGAAVRVCSHSQRLYISVAVVVNTTARGKIWAWVFSHSSQNVKAKFHYAIWSQTGSKQVRSWSQTCSELKYGLSPSLLAAK